MTAVRDIPKPRLKALLAAALASLALVAMLFSCGCVASESRLESASPAYGMPQYSGQPSVEVNGNIPFFTEGDIARGPFEEFSKLDPLGRCGAAFARLGPETLAEGDRGSIGMVKPSGWQMSKYDWVDGEYLFNRCHLIAYSLSGQTDNELDLITGTRSMNVLGMLPYETMTRSYIANTGNHVLYRVTPVFEGGNLVASGVLMEAQSVEDAGAGLRFCVWCYNVEPGVAIDYATGDSHADGSKANAPEGGEASGGSPSGKMLAPGSRQDDETRLYVLNTNTKRFHFPECQSVSDIKDKNKEEREGSRSEIIAMGYKPCGVCHP